MLRLKHFTYKINKEVFERIDRDISEHCDITLVPISQYFMVLQKEKNIVKGKRVSHRTFPLRSKIVAVMVPSPPTPSPMIVRPGSSVLTALVTDVVFTGIMGVHVNL